MLPAKSILAVYENAHSLNKNFQDHQPWTYPKQEKVTNYSTLTHLAALIVSK